MATTRVRSVSLPAGLVREAERLARQERRTRTKVLREALRRYGEERRWRGRSRAAGRRRPARRSRAGTNATRSSCQITTGTSCRSWFRIVGVNELRHRQDAAEQVGRQGRLAGTVRAGEDLQGRPATFHERRLDAGR